MAHAQVPAAAQLDVDALLKSLDAVELQGTYFFDRMCVFRASASSTHRAHSKDALATPYSDEDALGNLYSAFSLLSHLQLM